MERRLTNGQVVALVFIALLFGLGALIVSNINASKSSEPVYLKHKKTNGPSLELVGSYLEYVELGEPYVDKKVKCNSNGKNLNKEIQTMYLYDDNQIINVDYNKAGTYQIKYICVDEKNKANSVSRTVIVADNKAPSIYTPSKQVITTDEALSFDLAKGVSVSDNSGDAEFKYDNTLSTIPGDYVITYTAKDKSGNKTTHKRLIKVTSGINFTYNDNKLTIDYPSKDNYLYKYSTDSGNTWIEGNEKTTIDFSTGNVIASVYENDKYIMSNSFTK